jgi:hypothetical protein
MNDLDGLLKAARGADPGDRIDFRDPIAAYGESAIAAMARWLEDRQLGAFATRVLGKIAQDPVHRTAVVRVLAATDPARMSEPVQRDVAATLAQLRPASRGAGGAERTPRATPEHWPGDRAATGLELRFHDAMLDIFRLAGEATRRTRPDGSVARGYWASYFLRGVRNHGGVAYAHQLLRAEGTSDGFQRLTDERRLDLTVEALVLRDEYVELFNTEERSVAAHRLARAGYQQSRDD